MSHHTAEMERRKEITWRNQDDICHVALVMYHVVGILYLKIKH